MASLVIESAGFAGRVIELNLGANRFGRGPENEFQIEHPSVSDRHCDLVLAHNGIIVRDWASAKGTFIDGDRIKEAKLAPGQVLRLGQVELRVEKTEITVAIPEFTVPRQENSTVASLSVLFCSRHPATPATHRCSRCHKALCVTCARRVRRSGGRMVTLCSHCQGPCELVCSRQCGARATHQCTHCGKAVCDNCVRKLRRQGGKVLKICPLCTQECVLICPRHPEARAIYRCTHCEVGVCLDCARFTRRRGDPTSRVCPFCHYPCVLMCASHPEALATHHCNHCHKLLCPACVQQLRNHRGQIMRFCCHCSQPCAPVRDKMPRGKSLLDRLQAKVRTALRRGRKKAKTSRST